MNFYVTRAINHHIPFEEQSGSVEQHVSSGNDRLGWHRNT